MWSFHGRNRPGRGAPLANQPRLSCAESGRKARDGRAFVLRGEGNGEGDGEGNGEGNGRDGGNGAVTVYP